MFLVPNQLRADQDSGVRSSPPPLCRCPDPPSCFQCLTREQVDTLNSIIDEKKFCCEKLSIIEKPEIESWKIWVTVSVIFAIAGSSFTAGYFIKPR